MKPSIKNNNFRFLPDVVIVAVMSGKGGVGKTTTSVAIATACAREGLKTVLCDLDIAAPNVAAVAGLGQLTRDDLVPNEETMEIGLPMSPYGFYVANGGLLGGYGDDSNILELTRWTHGLDVIIVDLPGGWSAAHSEASQMFPHSVAMVVAPTETSADDHRLLVPRIVKARSRNVESLKKSDGRRNWDKITPKAPKVAVFETMSMFHGVVTDGPCAGEQVTIRRSDVEGADFVPELVHQTGGTFAGVLAPGSIEEISKSGPIEGYVTHLKGLLEEERAK